jgi:hypothetical protein
MTTGSRCYGANAMTDDEGESGGSRLGGTVGNDAVARDTYGVLPALSSDPVGNVHQAKAYLRDVNYRVRRRMVERFGDIERHQLRSMQRAYRGLSGPEVLVLSDSTMYFPAARGILPSRGIVDRRIMLEMIRDGLGRDVRVAAAVGPGYNQRMAMAYLYAISRCRSRPRVVVLSLWLGLAMSAWLDHPVLGYEKAAHGLRAAADAGRSGPRRLDPPTESDWDVYDHLPAPSLSDLRRSMGELFFITTCQPSARWPQTRWQREVQMRHRVDYYHGERLEPKSPGVMLIADAGRMLSAMDIPSVAYISGVNYGDAVRFAGDDAREHIRHNAEVTEAAYLEGAGTLGTVVNGVFDCDASDFCDPVHLEAEARRRMAASIVETVRPLLALGDPAG